MIYLGFIVMLRIYKKFRRPFQTYFGQQHFHYTEKTSFQDCYFILSFIYSELLEDQQIFNIFNMKTFSNILPMQFGNVFNIKKLSWDDFRGDVQTEMPWSAHIYWWIDYDIVDIEKRKIKVRLHLSNRSWVKQQKKCEHLLNHQQGHFLIGSLCALEFLRRLDYKKNSHQKFEDLVFQTFDRTIKQYLQLEKKYDNETEHRLNFKKQQEWENHIIEKLEYYKQIFDLKKNRFVKLSQSPSKK